MPLAIGVKGCRGPEKAYTIGMDSISLWINPVLVVGIGSLLWRFLIKRFDRIDTKFDRVDAKFDLVDARFDLADMKFGELTREVVANGKSIARIEGLHQGHPGPGTDPPGPRTLTPL